jgi:5'-nucleotidase (lipoprotein e(P4) family)
VGGNLYLQNSAEYRACCLTIYKSAELRMRSLLDAARPRPAVVLDLDETVFDNSAFQTYLYKNQKEYTDELWADYEKNYPQDVTLIPGARSFIEKAQAAEVAVVLYSNRSEQFRASTEKVLKNLGIAPALLLLKSVGGSSDKSARREAITAQYNVLIWVGDNLRDFSETFIAPKPASQSPADLVKATGERKVRVDDAECHWGIDWFVIPNPVYGEWERLIGADPLAIMHPTTMNVPAK